MTRAIRIILIAGALFLGAVIHYQGGVILKQRELIRDLFNDSAACGGPPPALHSSSYKIQ